MEMNLAIFYRRHIAKTIGGSHLPLVAGFDIPSGTAHPAIASMDWWFEPVPSRESHLAPAPDHRRVLEARLKAEEAAAGALAASPRRLREFRRLLTDTQRLVPIREEQVAELTIAWPVMRRAVVRIGEELSSRGVVTTDDDVFFLTRDELLAALQSPSGAAIDVRPRRAARAEQATLVPPLLVGRLGPILRRVWETFPRLVGAVRSEGAIVSGSPASPGRATGLVRVIRGPSEFDDLQTRRDPRRTTDGARVDAPVRASRGGGHRRRQRRGPRVDHGPRVRHPRGRRLRRRNREAPDGHACQRGWHDRER